MLIYKILKNILSIIVMVDKNFHLPDLRSDRLKEIDSFVDKARPVDYIDILKKQYNDELKDYQYVETVEEFSLLRPKGCIRYISKYDKKLRSGGLVIKIFENDSKWYAIVKNPHSTVRVSFSSNYIFYISDKKEALKDWMKCFVTDVERGLYEVE
jgi:hypothetical protein